MIAVFLWKYKTKRLRRCWQDFYKKGEIAYLEISEQQRIQIRKICETGKNSNNRGVML